MDPYRRIASSEIYRNPWLAVEVHDMVHPTGVRGEHLLIVPSPASAVLVVDGDEFLLEVQPRFGARRSVIEIVKGGRDAAETALACAQRELREELGIVAQTWVAWGEIYEIPSLLDSAVSLFMATDISTTNTELEAVERIDLLRLPIAEAYAMAERGEIRDAVTLAALLKFSGGRS